MQTCLQLSTSAAEVRILQTTLTRVIPSSQEGEFSKSSLISHQKTFRKVFTNRRTPQKSPQKKFQSREEKSNRLQFHTKKNHYLCKVYLNILCGQQMRRT
jgi:hypothetical protein